MVCEQARPEPRRRPGSAGLPAERARFLQLVAQGMTMSEACRVVNVNRKTGGRWVHGHRWSDPYLKEKARLKSVLPAGTGSRTLTLDERIYLADRRREHASMRAIAAELGRAVSTISRELKNNSNPQTGAYRPHAAHQRAAIHRRRPKTRKVFASSELFVRVMTGVAKKWSPEQIVRRLRDDFPGRRDLHVSHETVYQALYLQGRGELRRVLQRAMRSGQAVRRPRRVVGERPGMRMATPKVMISERPAEVEDRSVPGHWEGDLIIGKDHQSAVGTLVERTTRFVLLVHLPDGYHPEKVRDGIIDTMSALPAQLRRSLTWDQGREMHRHHEIGIATDLAIYFCDPHSPWQRGSNENSNGLLRQYMPKGTDLTVHTRRDLDKIAAQLNGRPRKTLAWRTPTEELDTLLRTTQ